MKKRKYHGESLVGIVVGVFILAIVIVGIGKLIAHSNETIIAYSNSTKLRLLKNNLSNILKNLDTSKVLENEIFYVYKDTINSEFKIFTGSTNSQYKYIDVNGDYVGDIINFEGDIYARVLLVQREDTALNSQNQVIQASIKKLIKK